MPVLCTRTADAVSESQYAKLLLRNESQNNAFPQTVTLDLGTAFQVDRVVLRLPSTFTTNTGWPAAQLSEFEVYAH